MDLPNRWGKRALAVGVCSQRPIGRGRPYGQVFIGFLIELGSGTCVSLLYGSYKGLIVFTVVIWVGGCDVIGVVIMVVVVVVMGVVLTAVTWPAS